MTSGTHSGIVLVDDDPDFLEIHRLLLDEHGYGVEAFSRPDEAWLYLEHASPGLVISDLVMDTLDAGFTLCRRIRARPHLANTKVIIMTSAGSRLGYDFRPRSPEEMTQMGVDGFLEKPVRPEVLLATVATFVAKRVE